MSDVKKPPLGGTLVLGSGVAPVQLPQQPSAAPSQAAPLRPQRINAVGAAAPAPQHQHQHQPAQPWQQAPAPQHQHQPGQPWQQAPAPRHPHQAQPGQLWEQPPAPQHPHHAQPGQPWQQPLASQYQPPQHQHEYPPQPGQPWQQAPQHQHEHQREHQPHSGQAWQQAPAPQHQHEYPPQSAQPWQQPAPSHEHRTPIASEGVAQDVPRPARSAVAGCLHAYPVSVRSAGLFSALRLTSKTAPYALFRFLHWSMFSTLSALLLFAVVGGSVALMVYVHQYAGAGFLLAGILAWALLWIPFVERKTFGTLCGHIAILTELITKGQVGNGNQGMFAFGNQIVNTRLGELSSIQDVYNTIRRSLYKLARALNFADGLLPIDLGPVNRAVYRVVNWMSPYITAVVLSYGVARNDDDLSVTGMDGLCYSAQNVKSLIKTALGVLVLQALVVGPLWLVSLAMFVSAAFYLVYPLAGGDLAALQAMLESGGVAALVDASKADPIPILIALLVSLAVGVALAYLFVKTVQESLVKPTLITMVMLKFHLAVENQPLDPAWRERVTGAGTALEGLDTARRRAGMLGV